MSKRLPCPPAPGPREVYALCFNYLFDTLAQRRGFREYLQGLLLPKDRNKTLTAALANTEPISREPKVLLPKECSFSSRSLVGSRRPSMPAAYRCSGKIRRRSRKKMVSSSSMSLASAKPTKTPLT